LGGVMSTIPMAEEDIALARRAVEKAKERAETFRLKAANSSGPFAVRMVGCEIDAERDLARCERLLAAAEVGCERGGTWDADDYGFLARMAG
jgi:hypothetical protein